MSEQLEKTCEKVLNLNPDNEAIQYIVKRLQHNKYRGGPKVPQHNYMSDKLDEMLNQNINLSDVN